MADRIAVPAEDVGMVRLDARLMPRQEQVANSFFLSTDEYTRASNLRIHYVSDGGSHAIIGGGRNGRERVLAERLPIGRFRVWTRPDFGNSMRYGDLRAQARRVYRYGRRLNGDGELPNFRRAREINDPDIPHRTPRIDEYAPEALD
jgi:hypothetical protein